MYVKWRCKVSTCDKTRIPILLMATKSFDTHIVLVGDLMYGINILV
jgi:hypothetical protein